MIKKYFILILLISSSILFSQSTDGKIEILNIDSRLELFTDYYLIDTLINVSLKLHEPIDKGVVLKFDKPWEGPFSAYCTVIDNGEKYQLYYRGLPTAGKDGRTDEHTCYAESEDGVNWTKPELGIFEVDGTKENMQHRLLITSVHFLTRVKMLIRNKDIKL